MKKHRPLVLLIVSALALSACADKDAGINYDGSKNDQGLALNRMVSDITDRLFATKIPGNTTLSPIAVTSMVNLSTLETTNWLGEQLAEDFVHELHRRGEVVLDYKVTGSIKVTPEGDFSMSRDWTELSKRVPASRILTGTMSRNDMGVVLNMRIINMRTRMVEATSQGFIPNEMLKGQLDSGRAVLVTKGMVVRGEFPYDQYGRALTLTH
jgi:TolB-like protein